MNEQEEQLKALSEMRDLMNKSSRFLSLSGLTGVFAGIFAMIGAGFAWFVMRDLYYHMPFSINEVGLRADTGMSRFLNGIYRGGPIRLLFMDACCVLFFSLLFGWYFSKRKAKKNGLPFWDATAWRMLVNLFIPLVAGGLFCLVLGFHGLIGLVAPATLIFYGLGLLNASKYTINDIRYLGISEIFLGLIASVFIAHGLIFWTIGFGVLHIVYGVVLYYKYERK